MRPRAPRRPQPGLLLPLPPASAAALVLALAGLVAPGAWAAGAQRQASRPAAKAPAMAVADRPANRAEAARFLARATYGANDFEVELLMKIGYRAWLDRQWSLPASSHRVHWEAADAQIKLLNPANSAGQEQVLEAFWKHAVNGIDQLRLRTAFALSQIFVISGLDSNVANHPRGIAAYLDLLSERSSGTYRELLESVALSPMMGLYLSHLRNQKADPNTGRIPDQNFAREILQLMSIGLVQLDPDGTPVLLNNRTVETYTPDDIAGLSKVFTGFSWACPAAPSSNGCFFNGSSNSVSDPDRAIKPMVPYPQFHSTEAKSFLGITIAAQNPADPAGSLRQALDRIAAHPNVGPFIGKQLIQRFVSSNPSPAYVAAVSAAFNDNGQGVRGDLRAVMRAVLTHPEALAAPGPGATKLREPVVKLSTYLRAFEHRSDTGNWRVGFTENPGTTLGQSPLRAPSVFNFWRPGYVAPGSQSAAAGLVAPELQVVNETSVAGYVNFMRDNLSQGVGIFNGTVGNVTFNRRDLQRDWSFERTLAARPAELVQHLAGRLVPSGLPDALLADIATTIGRISVPVPNGANQQQVDTALRNRLNAALLLMLASPEYQRQP